MEIKLEGQYGTRGNPTMAVKIDSVDRGGYYPVLGCVMSGGFSKGPNSWTSKGRFWSKITRQHPLDLVPLIVENPETKPREIYVWEFGSGDLTNLPFKTAEECRISETHSLRSGRIVKFIEMVEPADPILELLISAKEVSEDTGGFDLEKLRAAIKAVEEMK